MPVIRSSTDNVTNVTDIVVAQLAILSCALAQGVFYKSDTTVSAVHRRGLEHLAFATKARVIATGPRNVLR